MGSANEQGPREGQPRCRLEGLEQAESSGRSLAEDKRTEGGLQMPWRMSVCQQEWSRVRHAERKLPATTSGFRRRCSIRASDWIHRRRVSRRTVTGSELYSTHV